MHMHKGSSESVCERKNTHRQVIDGPSYRFFDNMKIATYKNIQKLLLSSPQF